MMKKKMICQYELLCLGNKKENVAKYEKLITELKNLVGQENITEIQEENWKPVYPIKKFENGTYWLIRFAAARGKIPQLEKNVLQAAAPTFLSRYNLINLTEQKKTKFTEKHVVE